LDVSLEVDQLWVSPRLPHTWESLKLHYRYHDTFYHITVKRAGANAVAAGRVFVDGKEQPDAAIRLVDDRREHSVEMTVP
jgi:cellobiose phosphorylase